MNDLQKELFLESMHLIHEPGWEVLQEGGLTAFKAQVTLPFMNFVYGTPTPEAYKKVKAFYQKQPFFWLLSPNQEEQPLLDWGFTGPDQTFQMELNLSEYQQPTTPSKFEVGEASSTQDHSIWIHVAAEWLKADPSFVDEFFTPWIKTGKYTFYLGFSDTQPAEHHFSTAAILGQRFTASAHSPLSAIAD